MRVGALLDYHGNYAGQLIRIRQLLGSRRVAAVKSTGVPI